MDGAIARKVFMLEVQSREAIAMRDYQRAISLLSELMYFEPTNPYWLEMRGLVCVDGRNYAAAIMDLNEALKWTPSSDVAARARILAGRATALEGQEVWEQALQEFQSAQKLALQGGEPYDANIILHIGNCQASLRRWQEARDSYLKSAELLVSGSDFRILDPDTQPQRDDHVVCLNNAAMMLAQMGDLAGAREELERAESAGSANVDTAAALAALYYDAGQPEDALKTWNSACMRPGACARYKEKDWLEKVKRWPPVMVEKTTKFLAAQETIAFA